MIRSIHLSRRAMLRTSCEVAAVCTLAATSRAQTLMRTVNGPSANALFGAVCIRIGDQNGDGFKDVLVGAPGFNQQRGAIYCVSGQYLASGNGSQILWSLAPTANQGDLFGTAIADVGDITGDGRSDFLVGQPGYDDVVAQDVGAIRLVDGFTHAVVSLLHQNQQGKMFGSAIAALSDVTGDGKREFVVGAPGPNSSSSTFYIAQSGTFALSSGAIGNWIAFQAAGADELGASLASGFDVNGDGFQDFVVGSPGKDGPSAANSGMVALCTYSPAGLGAVKTFVSSVAGERLGTSLASAGDCDGDGIPDFVAGAPNTAALNGTQPGRALVLSSARVIAQTPPYEIYTLDGAQDQLFSFHSGEAVCADADLNGDGVRDILVGSPDYSHFPFGSGVGLGSFAIYSGASGARIGGAIGGTGDHLGEAFGGAIDDLDGDGFKEFVVAAPQSDAAGTDSGMVRCYRLFPLAPAIYCTGKLNSLGCTPSMSFNGLPSETSGAAFVITGSNFVNQKNGLLFYSHRPNSVLFQGGTKCVHDPTVRTPTMSSAGSTSGSDCTGTYALDFNAWIANGPDSSLGAGVEVYAQYWSRDPASPSHTSLSNAIRFVINP
jgi:hypothetical protein